MPAKSKRGKSVASNRPSAGDPKQARFPPKARTVTLKNAKFVTPRTKQQTLTQIDFVTRDHLLEDDEMALEHEEEEPALAHPPKRRRINAERGGTPTVQTRSARRRSIKVEEESGESIKDCVAATQTPVPQRSKGIQRDAKKDTTIAPQPSMPPPKTPAKDPERVIPSSQSPTCTPLSIRSRASRQETSVSPLKQLSANTRRRPQTRHPIENAKQMPKLEVRDTFAETGKSQIPTQTAERAATSLQSHRPWAKEHIEDAAQIPQFEADFQSPILPLPRKTAPVVKSEVLESDEENGNDTDAEDFHPGDDTQAAFIHLSSEPNEDLQLDVAPEDNTEPHQVPDHHESGHISSPPRLNTHSALEPALPSEQASPIIQIPSSQEPPSLALHGRTDAEQISAQLTADLSRATQPFHPALETDTQFENAWQPLSLSDLAKEPEPLEEPQGGVQERDEPTLPTMPASKELALGNGVLDGNEKSKKRSRRELILSSDATTPASFPSTQESTRLPSSQTSGTSPRGSSEVATGTTAEGDDLKSRPALEETNARATKLVEKQEEKGRSKDMSSTATSIVPKVEAIDLASEDNPLQQHSTGPALATRSHHNDELANARDATGAGDAEIDDDATEDGSQRHRPKWDYKPLTDSQMLPDSVMNFRLPAWLGATQASQEEEEEEEEEDYDDEL